MGELVAWIIGWDLILEYGVSVAAVAVGWGGNLNEFLDNTFGFALPESVATSPEDGGVFNLPAVFIVVAVTLVLIRGVRETAKANIDHGRHQAARARVLHHRRVRRRVQHRQLVAVRAGRGTPGVVDAAAIIFFAYIGFDAVSTGRRGGAEPEDGSLPIAIVGSLLFCTLIYIPSRSRRSARSTPTALQESDAPLAEALDEGAGISWAASLMAFGALVAITSVHADRLLRPDPDLLRDGARRPDAAPDRRRSTPTPARRSSSPSASAS